MLDTIVLFTPLHTGTHFVRMLLEAHPQIGLAIGEDYRIDPLFRPGYILAGEGKGSLDAVAHPGRYADSEQLLLKYFCDWLAGETDREPFQRSLESWPNLRSETTLPLTNGQRLGVQMRRQFAELGIDLESKHETYRLYRGHCHSSYATYDLTKLTAACKVVATVRHPLRSVITILRREPPANHEALIEDYLVSIKTVFSLSEAFLFCTDLWQQEPGNMGRAFEFLGLPITPAVRKFMELRPAVNHTVSKSDEHGVHNYCFEFEHRPEFLGALKEARQMLAGGQVHPLLQPYWARIEAAGVLPHYERLGYQF